jgi:hypothetical protein
MEMEIEQMKKSFDFQGELAQVQGRTEGHSIQSHAKLIAERIRQETEIEKQKLANQRPKPATKK